MITPDKIQRRFSRPMAPALFSRAKSLAAFANFGALTLAERRKKNQKLRGMGMPRKKFRRISKMLSGRNRHRQPRQRHQKNPHPPPQRHPLLTNRLTVLSN